MIFGLAVSPTIENYIHIAAGSALCSPVIYGHLIFLLSAGSAEAGLLRIHNNFVGIDLELSLLPHTLFVSIDCNLLVKFLYSTRLVLVPAVIL